MGTAPRGASHKRVINPARHHLFRRLRTTPPFKAMMRLGAPSPAGPPEYRVVIRRCVKRRTTGQSSRTRRLPYAGRVSSPGGGAPPSFANPGAGMK